MGKDKYVAYVGTYTHENSLGIHIYDVDVESGTIEECGALSIFFPSPSRIASTRTARFLPSGFMTSICSPVQNLFGCGKRHNRRTQNGANQQFVGCDYFAQR